MIRKISVSLIVIGILFIGPYSGAYQEQSNVSATNIIAAMIKPLKLKVSQVKEISPVISDWVKQAQSVKAGKLSLEEQQRQLTSLQEDMEAQLAHYLSEDQLTRWHAMIAKAPSHLDKPGGGHSGSGKGSSGEQKFTSENEQLSTNSDGVLQSGPSNSVKDGVY